MEFCAVPMEVWVELEVSVGLVRRSTIGTLGVKTPDVPSGVQQVAAPYGPTAVSTEGSLFSTGRPAACQAAQPPTRARAFGHPAARSSSATRALVASSFHAQ